MSQVSNVEICNMALMSIKADTIQDFYETTPSAVACQLIYPQARRVALQQCDWSFARRIAYLPLLNNVKVTGWKYCYKKPVDCLQARRIYHDVKNADPIAYEEYYDSNNETSIICADIQDASLVYTVDVENPLSFSSLFVDLLHSMLCLRLLKPLKGTIKDSAFFHKQFLTAKHEAELSEANSGRQKKKRKNSLLNSRFTKVNEYR